MKIDLHCHTKAVRSGELPTRNVSKEKFLNAVVDAGVEVVAITNHDVFDKDQYEEFVEHVKDAVQIWPGIEFAVTHDDKAFHLIVVGNPKNADEFSNDIKSLNLDAEKEPNVALNIILDTFRSKDVLFIPHFGGKKPAIPQETLEYLRDSLGDKATRIIVEDTNERSVLILTDHGFNAITGSDVRDWNSYASCSVSDLRLSVDSFEQFCLLIERDEQAIDAIIKKNNSHTYRAKPSKEDGKIIVPLTLYEEVNVLFGDKGTGKSNILNSIEKEARADGLKVACYRASQKDDDFNELLDVSDMARESKKLKNMDNCAEDFDLIKRWADKDVSSLNEYYKFSKDAERRKDKSKIKLLDNISPENYDSNKLTNALKDRRQTHDISGNLVDIAKKYLSEDDCNTLEKSLKKLHLNIDSKVEQENIAKSSASLLRKSLDSINSSISMKTGTSKKPIATGFMEYAKNRISIHASLNRILTCLDKKDEEYIKYEPVGSIGGKGNLTIAKRWSMLGDKGHEKYKGYVNITSLKSAKTSLGELYKISFAVEIEDTLHECKESISDIDSIDCFIGVEKYPALNQVKYSPSSGEKAILMIQRVLNEDADVYILDEPEMSLGGLYIDEVIRQKISNLGKQKKTVVMATHNANLAVRTLPYCSIFRTYRDSAYSTYIGNPFVNELVNLTDKEDRLNWKEESMKTLEGGKEAFDNRGEIYGTER